MRVGRRGFLGGATASAAFATGCDRLLSAASRLVDDPIPRRIDLPASATIDPAHHLLSRAAFGAGPADRARVARMGKVAWVDEQLDPEEIDDVACDLRAGFIDTVSYPPGILLDFPPDQIEGELRRNALLRAVYSKRQLHEVMVEIWTDHFNVAIQRSLCRHLKTADDREVVRKHALGRFDALLRASVTSPAMLVYLDGRENRRPDGAGTPNENHARELLELHTLGARGGYDQSDVMEAARCLTGFVIDARLTPGEAAFVPERHDDGDKIVLGQRISGGGPGDVDKLVRVLVEHPSTARFIARKLCVALVDDVPPESIVADAAAAFTASQGDLKRVVRTILLSDAFEAHAGTKLKRPFRQVVSTLRALAADTHAKDDVIFAQLGRMGQPLFAHPTPDGFPLEAEHWLATFPARFAFALDVAHDRVPGVTVPWSRLERSLDGASDRGLGAHLFGRTLSAAEATALSAVSATSMDPRRVALLLSSPAFVRH